MTGELEGRVAIVTGGGRGLGRAMAVGLARAGAAVLITAARESSEVEEVAHAAAAEFGEGRMVPMQGDVTQQEDCRRVVDRALGHFGRVDILVNNAGRGMKYVSDEFLTKPTRFWEADPEAWRLVIDTNVNGPFLMARAAAPAMIAAGSGRILNVSMNHSTMRRAGFSPYGPSKAALESETVIWAQDLAGTGVTVNAILPGGATLTGMIPAGFPEAARAQLLAPEIIVPPLLWLASDASAGFTGRRVDASRWRGDLPAGEAAAAATDDAGWA
ncbi:3-oxoacyl-[acyl-carrier protein] reductase [Faunimonas pinastri]|uniref:3-oxoacyl-[acyl-carrier protein] reductase n=1 Tax=Faunimonas pinastri TaxID=1855383 RepID=A0A1H9HG18_9HYPH|nr:SDR family oxidoreductase [Faunimonas pinastri]SEQ61265.1 3-oxoacyl-[acyl-carrier protein] reductase [Faunimonas pinastri]